MAPQDDQDVNDGTNDVPDTADSSRNDPERDLLNPPVPISTSNACDEQPISLMSDLWLVVSIITFAADVASDLLVSVQYYSQKNYWYFGLTLVFVSTASLILQIFSIKWFRDDGKTQTCKLYILHLFQMGPLFRYWSAIKLCWMSRHGGAVRADERFVSEWRDLCMLRLLQAFIQSAPQLVFQLFVLSRQNSFVLGNDLMIGIAAITSLISVVWSLVCYSKALRDLRENARDLPWLGFTFQVLWRGCMVTSRIVALVLFASHFQLWMVLAVAGHWLLMALWLSCQRTQFCIDENGKEHPCKEKLFNSIIAFIYIFCFFNTKEGMTRKRIVLYYSVMLVENSLLISMWYPHRMLSPFLTYAALGAVWGGFVLGVFFMILYYRFYHHSHTFKGLFLRKRRFTLHGRKMYGLYFCCCFRIKKWELGLYDISNSDPQLLMSRGVEEDTRGSREMDPEAFHRDNPQNANFYWDHDDIQMRPLNGACVKGRDNGPDRAILLQNTHTYEDPDEVPDIIITAASPTSALSPHDSESSLPLLADKSEDPANSEMTCTCENDEEPTYSNQSPGETPVDKAKKILASKLHKVNETKDDDDESDVEEDIPKINYGSVSFGNRYSLVSSDCISLSSESSLSSFTNSLNDLLDRMGVSAKTSHEPDDSVPKTPSGADEGIFSDERDSPTKSSSDKETDPVANHQKDIKNRVKLSDSSANSENAISLNSFQEVEEEDVMESIMDAPTSPCPTKKTSSTTSKDEGNESESTDASSDGNSNDRNRRYSCEERLIDYSSNNSFAPEDEEINKRHSFDIAELSRKTKRAKKKGRNRRRLNKIITFDNFVASSLKPGKFGSLRERLAKIQEDTEELGLLSDEVLPAIQEPPSQDALLSDNGIPGTDGMESDRSATNGPRQTDKKSFESELEHPTTNNIVRDTNDEPFVPLWVKNEAKEQRPLRYRDNVKENENFDSKDNEKDTKSLDEINKDSMKTRFRPLDEGPSTGLHDEESSEESSDDVVLIEELTPSRFSTVRRSLETVPLACLEDFEDFDDFGTDDDSLRDSDERLRSPASPTMPESSSLKKPDIYATDSNDSASIKDRVFDEYCSSGSSLFENLLYLETDQSSLGGRFNKRHTYDFGSNRVPRQGKVKRLGASSSQYAMPTPGSPVWVHKAIFKHRRRTPKVVPQPDGANNSDSAIGFIQEIRV